MKHVLFFQHGEYDGPGLLGAALKTRGVHLDCVHLWRGDAPPQSLQGVDGVAIGGGSMSVYEADLYPYLEEEMALIREARTADIPVLGLCLGAQLIVQALGGHVFPNTGPEIGLYAIHFTPAAEEDPLWSDYTQSLTPVHWHSDTFSLPPGARLLASSALSEHQLFCVDELIYGLQFHLEIDRASLREMILIDGECLRGHGVDPNAFMQAGEAALPSVEPIARAVFERWADFL